MKSAIIALFFTLCIVAVLFILGFIWAHNLLRDNDE